MSLCLLLQPRVRRNALGLGSSHFDRHYSGNRFFFLFLQVLRCFSSLRSPWLMPVTGLQPAGFPHSDISGSFPVCRSPELFAAYHVFLRLRKPRHPPFALLLFLVLRESYATLTVSYFLVFAYFEIAVLFATRKNSNFFSDLISFYFLPRYLSQYCHRTFQYHSY